MASNSPTVLDGVLQRTSPSAIETFSRCQTAWWLRYVAHAVERIREKVKNAQNLGTRAHKELEVYLLTGAAPNDEFAKALLKYAPAPGLGLIVEGHTELLPFPSGAVLRAAGILMTGRIDFTHALLPTRPIVADWKTRSDLGAYQKTEEELKKDVQMGVYARWASEYYPKAESVDVAHYYAETKHHRDQYGLFKPNPDRLPKTDSVLINFTIDDVHRSWSDIEHKVEGMKSVAAIKVASNCKSPGQDAMSDRNGPCNAFGGCGYRWACPHYEMGRPPVLPGSEPVKKEMSMGLMDILKAEKAKKEAAAAGLVAAPAPAPAPVVAAGVVPPDAPPEVEAAPAPAPSAPISAPVATSTPTPDAVAVQVQAQAQVEHVDARTPEAQALDTKAAETGHTHKYDVVLEGKAACACGRKKPGRSAAPAPALAQGEPAPANAPAQNAPAQVAEPAPATPEQIKEALASVGVKLGPAIEAPLSLYINAITNAQGVKDLTGYVYEAAKAVATTGGAVGTDPRFTEGKNNPLAYGGWRGALAEYVRMNPPSGRCVLHTNGDELAECVAAALAPVAYEVIRGR